MLRRNGSWVGFLTIASLAAALTLSATPPIVGQSFAQIDILSYQAFAQLSTIYQSGSQAPALVGKLNDALNLIQDANISRSEGDQARAFQLESQANAQLLTILSEAPGLTLEAQRDAAIRVYSVVTEGIIVIVSSTFLFYVMLGTWRSYEKAKLYEMEIVYEADAED